MKKKSKTMHWPFLIFVSLLYILPHWQLLTNHAVAFSFDHGKDSLAVMEMVLTKSPKLIGPWTSIPGLYFGPGWYYLLAPFYLVFNFSPMSGAYAMALLGLIQVWLVYKYFGKVASLIVATTPFWLAVTGSAWNPFPITLTTWGILIALKLIGYKSKSFWPWVVLGFSAGMGFHFSTAFAILYPLLIAFGLWLRKIKINFASFSALLASFAAPFLPQLIFELRHGFVQVRSAWAYITGQVDISNQSSPENSVEIFKQIIFQIQSATLPDITGHAIEKNIFLFFLGLWIVKAISEVVRHSDFPNLRKVADNRLESIELLFWILVTGFWLRLTHFNSWYLYGLMPVAVIFVSNKIVFRPFVVKQFLMLLLILTPIASMVRFELYQRSNFENDKAFLPVKERAISEIYQRAGDKPFASYHYQPDIYDFAYQYLYFYQAKLGNRLPTEFTYQSDVATYIVQKENLLAYFSQQQDGREPELKFFIVESPEVEVFLEEWWNHQNYDEILEEVEMSEDVKLFEAR